jgi:CRISPR/Cas system-associated exonuclease Cas4 (RecB family)
MFKIYPSSIAPVSGVTTNGYKEGCPRFFFAANTTTLERVDIPYLYKTIGDMEETRITSRLEKLYPDLTLEREVPVKFIVPPNLQVSGRVDIIAKNEDGTIAFIHEIKATVSRSMYSRVIKAHQIDEKHLGQLITYMTLLDVENASLSVGYYHFNRELTRLDIEEVQFKVELSKETGSIFIDSNPYFKSAHDILKYYRIMADAVNNASLPPMTINKKACESCPFNNVCEKNPKSKEEFHRYLKEQGVSESKAPFTPKINIHNTRS